ncbi:protein kinase family protein [Nonomuraea sp. PA05]|uniref:protein kinase family protein n=1 Tax=Nonomuraea sp. PA05 TaxID=2604466 RepID=UPI0011DAC92C|nr:protein kinase family protein [Nonomuraea sp. PA05]TYB51805.1 protein kinase family protein [Nonomuraea sp. PA05]
MPHPDRVRLASYDAVSTRLAMLSDRELAGLVAGAEPRGAGIGGRSAELEVAGVRVFVKRVPLTDLEVRPEHVRSTANVFGLPMFYQYGVGSAGFGAWRELAAHVMTTNWVLTGAYPGFPLLHHWRVIPDVPPEGFADEFGGIAGAVAHWEGSEAVRGRLEAIAGSSLSLVLFLEHLPGTLAAWLAEHRAVAPYPWLEQALARGTGFLSSQGFVHFDAHFMNLLTDGGEVYFADLGLALSRRFTLSGEESRFLADHLSYDRHYTTSHLLRHHLPGGMRGPAEHAAFLRDWTAGGVPREHLPAGVAGVLDRHAATALVFDDFFERLVSTSKKTPYPRATLDRA